MIVAIDGPAGAGKSTVARALAERLGFRYLDTGAMYRALTWLAMKRGLDLGDAKAWRSWRASSPSSSPRTTESGSAAPTSRPRSERRESTGWCRSWRGITPCAR